MIRHLRGHQPEGERQVAAQLDNIGDGIVCWLDFRSAAEPDKQCCGFVRRQRIKADTGDVVKSREPYAASDYYQAAIGCWEQMTYLLVPGRVIKDQQDLRFSRTITPQVHTRL